MPATHTTSCSRANALYSHHADSRSNSVHKIICDCDCHPTAYTPADYAGIEAIKVSENVNTHEAIKLHDKSVAERRAWGELEGCECPENEYHSGKCGSEHCDCH